MHTITFEQLDDLAFSAAQSILSIFGSQSNIPTYAIPRGGISAALAIGHHVSIKLVDDPAKAELFIDDIIDTGNTMQKLCDDYPGVPFIVLIDKMEKPDLEAFPGYVVFPWEKSGESSLADNITRILQFIGEDPTREGLQETPMRVAKAWQTWAGGYQQDPAKLLKVFEDGSEGCDEMVVVKDIPFYSHCEHHMAPFFGSVSIGYLPNGGVVGLSKLGRLVDVFAQRLQVQERMTTQIAEALETHLGPLGVGVVVTARHLCMESRGLSKQGQTTTTSALRGVFKENPQVRAEFFGLIK